MCFTMLKGATKEVDMPMNSSSQSAVSEGDLPKPSIHFKVNLPRLSSKLKVNLSKFFTQLEVNLFNASSNKRKNTSPLLATYDGGT